jgi:hypothetical protein
VTCAVRAIRRQGLNVSPTKSEALGFYDHRIRGAPPPELCVDIDGEEVPVDVRSTFRSAGPENDGSSQRPMRFTAEHRRSGNQSAPSI